MTATPRILRAMPRMATPESIEPYGTLILAVAVTVIEVALIVSLMLAGGASATALARDTVFAAIMIAAALRLQGGLIDIPDLHRRRRRSLQPGSVTPPCRSRASTPRTRARITRPTRPLSRQELPRFGGRAGVAISVMPDN